VLALRGALLHEVDLVLQDDDVLEAHDLYGCQVLRRLRLRAALVARDEEQRAVHDGRPVQHRSHQNVVTLCDVTRTGIADTMEHGGTHEYTCRKLSKDTVSRTRHGNVKWCCCACTTL